MARNNLRSTLDDDYVVARPVGTQIGQGAIGLGLNALLSPINSLLSKLFFSPIGKKVAKGIYDVSSTIVDTVTGDVIPKIQANASEISEAYDAADEARKAADLEKQNRAIAENQTQRQLLAAEKQAAIEAQKISEQSRGAAVSKFQQESAGQAALATSGLAEGSSPYAYLESSIKEMDRGIRNWFGQSMTGLELQGQNVTTWREGRAQASRSSVQQESLLRRQSDKYEKAADEASEGFIFDAALNMMGGLLKGASAIYGISSQAGAIGKMLGAEGTGIGGMLGKLTSMSSDEVLSFGTAFAESQLTGSPVALDSLNMNNLDGGNASQFFEWNGMFSQGTKDFFGGEMTIPETPLSSRRAMDAWGTEMSNPRGHTLRSGGLWAGRM